MVPPLIKCAGIHTPSARAANGIYEYQGAVWGRPCYHQAGISSGNHVWFAQEAYQGPMWVITPKPAGLGAPPTEVLAMSRSLARWPWEVSDWLVCSPHGSDFVPSRHMRFNVLNPVAELEVQQTTDQGVSVARFRCAGDINGRPAYKRIDPDRGQEQRLFFMPKMSRWMLADLTQDTNSIDYVVARSHADDGASWASLWPWSVEKGGWERATAATLGFGNAGMEGKFVEDNAMHVRMLSPNIVFFGLEGAPVHVQGTYEGRGMINGRVYYLQKLENAMSDNARALALWFAEDRGQWVITGADRLGDSTQVIARIGSRAWWPWEAQLASNSSPSLLGAAMLAALPPWHEGAALLSSLRASWQMADEKGEFLTLKDMGVECLHYKYVDVTAGEGSKHKFVGKYVHAGLLSSRPFFMQQRKNKRKPMRFALWYAEDAERWVITRDFRLLDASVVEARADDSTWFPWDVASSWEVGDGQGDFVADILLKVAWSKDGPGGKKKKLLDAPSVNSEEQQSVVSGAGANDDEEDENVADEEEVDAEA